MAISYHSGFDNNKMDTPVCFRSSAFEPALHAFLTESRIKIYGVQHYSHPIA